MAISKETIDSLSEKLTGLLGSQTADSLKQDIQGNIRALLQSNLSKLDLVTRDEFEAQLAVLQRTRAKLEELEKQLETLNQ